jgi:hypothetical protein
MTLTQEANRVAWAIHNDGEQVGNVATEDTHVQSLGPGLQAWARTEQ